MKKILLILLVMDLAAVNIGLGFVIYETQIVQTQKQEVSLISREVDNCGPDCQKYIGDKISSFVAGQVTPVPQPTPKPVVITRTLPKALTRTVSYVTIPGNGSTTQNDWQGITGTDFYFDTSDYLGLTEIYFEANMKLFNGNGMAYVRLFDVSHGIGIQGSEIYSNSQIDSPVISGQVTFWSGKNLIRVQAKTLTADTAIYNYGRLKVVTEN